MTMLEIKAIDHIVLTVRDVDVTAEWYGRVLGMRREDRADHQGHTRTSMHFGVNKLNLRPLSATQESWFTAHHPASGSYDLCFLTDLAPDRIADHMQSNGVTIELGPVIKEGACGPLMSIYVRDPDGNLIEVANT